MSYKVSKFYDGIKQAEKKKDFSGKIWDDMYEWFDTFEQAKQFCIDRNKKQIAKFELKIKALKRKQPQLQKLTEKIKKL